MTQLLSQSAFSSSPNSSVPDLSPMLTSEPLGWEPLLVEEYQLPPGQVEMGSGWQGHSIALCLSPHPYRVHQILGRQRYTGLYAKGDISIMPMDVPASYHVEGIDHYLNIQLPTTFVRTVGAQAADLDVRRLDLVTEFRTRDPQLEQTLMLFRAELHKGGGWVSQLYVESLANILAIHLLRQYSTSKPQVVRDYRGGLGDRRLLQISDYIQAHLDQPIRLSGLAAIADMSQYHFSRLFKQSTGLSPHKYVINQRVEKAKKLLKESNLSLSDIALECGFNSQSHFGKSFRDLASITPSQYRKNHSWK